MNPTKKYKRSYVYTKAKRLKIRRNLKNQRRVKLKGANFSTESMINCQIVIILEE